MSNDRLPTELWVSAQLRRFLNAGKGAYLIRRGDAERGAVLVRLSERDGSRILTQIRDLDGKPAWLGAKDGAVMTHADAEAYAERAVARDSDLWIIEIEVRPGENPFDGEAAGL